MKIALKYCIAFLFFLSLIFYTHASLASIKKFDETIILNTSIKIEEVKKVENNIPIIDSLFRA